LLAVHQLLGWQAYLLTYASGGEASTPEPLRKGVLANSHLNPVSSVFTKQQRVYALLSVLGMLATGAGLYVAAGYVGAGTVALLYLMPYIWLNNWMVAITYLHHTHPDVHHFESSTWTYIDGALGTVDRPFGFVGEYIFHGIIDYHVVHHLFP
jgi:omega-6 fatty acid desaturase (delta-12 desaturase)